MLESTDYAEIKLLGFVEAFYGLPRFGHTKDVSYFYSDDKTLRNDYTLGLLLVFTILMGTAILWFLILLIMRLLGNRVGCGSGDAATIPAESMAVSKGGSYSVHTDETGEFIVMQADQNRVNRTRIIYFISGLYTIAATGVLIFGFFKISGALSEFEGHILSVDANVGNAPETMTSLLEEASNFVATRDAYVSSLSTFCLAPTGNVNGQDPSAVKAELSASLTDIGDISVDGDWSTLKTDLQDMQGMIQQAVSFLDKNTGMTALWFILVLSALSCMVIAVLYLLAQAWKSGKEGYQFVGEFRPTCGSRILHFFVTPIFGIVLAAVWFTTSTMLAAHAINSDVCYDEITTGDTILRMMVERGYANNSDPYILVDEYLHGCATATATPNTVLNSFSGVIGEADITIASFKALAPNGDTTDLNAACGGGGDAIMTQTATVSDELSSFEAYFDTLYGSVSCETMAPIMQQAVYETSCNNLSVSILWTFVPGLIAAVFGTIMMSLRSATQRPQIYIVAPNPASRDSDLENMSSNSFG